MNLVLFSPEEVRSGVARVSGRRARHIADVLKARPGQVLRAGIERGPRGSAEILDASRESVTLRVDCVGESPEPPAVDLILALPRPKAVSRCVQTAAALGVRRVDIVNAWRVDKSYFSSKRLEPDALATDLRLGCEQGGTTWVPHIAVHRLLVPFLDRVDVTGRLAAVAHPHTEQRIESVLAPGDATPITVAIGPDGGWIDRELSSFADLGFQSVSLGAHVMRVEAAVAATLAEIELLRRL